MARRIDVLLTFDTSALLDAHEGSEDPDAPAPVDPAMVHVITPGKEGLHGQAGSGITLAARIGDVIHWRESSASPTASALLYDFLPEGKTRLFSPPTPVLETVRVPVLNPDDPTQPSMETIQDAFWRSRVVHTGRLRYRISFLVTDRSGAVRGYYAWEPMIHFVS